MYGELQAIKLKSDPWGARTPFSAVKRQCPGQVDERAVQQKCRQIVTL